MTIAVQQQRRHHRRVKRRLPALARIRGFDLTKVERLEHKRQNEASQIAIEFDSVERAIAAHDSPAYQEALAALGNTCERDMRIVEGVD